MYIEENTSKLAGGRYHTKRYYETLETKTKPKAKSKTTDPRNGEEIANDIIGRLAGVT